MKVRLFTLLSLIVVMGLLLALVPGGVRPSSATNATSSIATTADAQNVEFVGHIGGTILAVAVQGNYAYIGEGPRLTILNVSNPASPTVVGKTPPLPDVVRGVYVAGGYAYVADHNAGLRVVDVSNPANPMEVGFYHTPGNVEAVAVAGDYAYVAAGGLRVVDVSDPTTPVEVGFYEHGGSVAVAGIYAYIASGNSLRVVDVSDPFNPEEVGFYDTLASTKGVAVAGDYAYVVFAAEGGSSLQIIDISTPSNPRKVGSWSVGLIEDVAVVGGHAYVVILDAGMWVVDISTPTNPGEAGFYDTPGYANGVDVVGGYAYVTNLWADVIAVRGGLRVVDILVPANPRRVGSYYTHADVQDVAVVGDYAYVATVYSGLRVVDVSNPSNPTWEGSYYTPEYAKAVAVAGGYAYVVGDSGYPDYDGWLRVVNISTPASPTGVGFYDTPGSVHNVAVAGNYAYVADGSGGLIILRYLRPSSIIGRVLDSGGDPVEGVQITVSAEYNATTDASGTYTITDVPPGAYTLIPTTPSYFWSPASRTVAVPPDATGQNFTGQNLQKAVTPSGLYAVNYGDSLTYTVRLVFPENRTLVLYDRVPTYTTYISGSLNAPMGVIHDPIANAISGTLSLTTGIPETVTFAVRVGVTGTVGLAPSIINRACVYPVGEGLAECMWSNEVHSYTYVWPICLPLVLR